MSETVERLPSLEQLLDRVEISPIASIRSTVGALLTMLNDPDSKPGEIRRLIQTDPPLAAKLLRVANSPFYGSRRKIKNIDEAFIWIGLDVLKEILLTQKISELYQERASIAGYSRAALWRHSLAVALLARTIFRREFGDKGANAYVAGLMHDIGLIVLDQLAHPEFCRVLGRIEDEHRSIIDEEYRLFGYDHGTVGLALVKRWDFPDALQEGIGFHHRPELASAEHAQLVKTIFVADYLMFANGYGYLDMALPDRDIFDRCAADLGLSDYSCQSLLKAALDDLHELGE